MVRSLLMLLVDEVREMKREFVQVRSEVGALRAWRGDVDKRIDGLAAENQSHLRRVEQERTKGRQMQTVVSRLLESPHQPAPSESFRLMDELEQLRSPPFTFASTSSPTLSAQIVRKLAPLLPFLSDYDFRTVPFVLDDVRFRSSSFGYIFVGMSTKILTRVVT
jgi:hypothetical protein